MFLHFYWPVNLQKVGSGIFLNLLGNLQDVFDMGWYKSTFFNYAIDHFL